MAQQTSQDRIQALVENFVQDLTTEIRNSAMESVAAAIGGMPTATIRRKPAATVTQGAPKTTRKRRGRGRKQQRSTISAEALLRAIEQSQGERTEVIARGLGVSAKSFKPVLDELVHAGTVVRKGKARGTTLHIG